MMDWTAAEALTAFLVLFYSGPPDCAEKQRRGDAMNQPKRITLSERRRQHVYSAVHEQIMRTRIEVAKLLGGQQIGRQVDDLLSDLNRNGPAAALTAMNDDIKKGR